MGYDVHITRAESWLDAEDEPIGREEWNEYASNHPDMRQAGWVEWADIGREAVYNWPAAHEDYSSLSWRDGRVTVSDNYTDYIPGLVAIASDLQANLIGDEGERYAPDGSIESD